MIDDYQTTVKTQFGEMYTFGENDLISSSLKHYGEWAQNEIFTLSHFLKKDDVVLDIGANLGVFTLAFSNIVGIDGAIYSFEPHPEAFFNLEKNSKHLANIHTFNFGLSNVKGRYRISSNTANYGASKFDYKEKSKKGSLCKELDEVEIDRKVDFIKIDIEGDEIRALEGGSKLIKKDRPVMFIEANFLEEAVNCLTYFKRNGYVSFAIISKAFNEKNFLQSEKNIFGEASEVGILAIHDSKIGKHKRALEKFQLYALDTIDDFCAVLLAKEQYYDLLVDKQNIFIPNIKHSLLVSKKQADLLKKKVLESDAQIDLFNQEVAGRDLQLESMKQGILERDARIDSFQDLILEYNLQVESLRNSNSWKITMPLRLISERFQSVFGSTQVTSNTKVPEKIIGKEHAYQSGIDRGVAIVLPVYRDVALTSSCIEAAMPDIADRERAILVIVNDASPEPEMDAAIDSAKSIWKDKIEVVRNPTNLGFVKSVNGALNKFQKEDIVLLNSDVILPKKWLFRLRAEAYSSSEIGTITPISNNTTICTFPEFLQDNHLFLSLKVDEVDAAFSSQRIPNIESPTGVGFCMYLKRDCIDTVGFLNEEKFPRGYGEENDFCQRAIKLGWKNFITPNLYAYHKGGVSFGDEKEGLVLKAMKVINELHPNYHKDVQEFIQNDPIKKSRIFRLISLLSRLKIPKILHVSHGLGGGVQAHIDELSDYLNSQANSFSIILIPVSNREVKIRMGAGLYADELQLSIQGSNSAFLYLMHAIGISLVHYHHIINVPGTLLRLPDKLKIPYRFTVHDYYLICANPTLTNKSGVFFDDESQWLNNEMYKLPDGLRPDTWREKYKSFLESADIVIYPSTATHHIMSRFFEPNHIIITPHIEIKREVHNLPSPLNKKSTYKVGVIGALGIEKGADRLEELAHLALLSEYVQVEFILIGYAYKPTLKNVKITGEYSESNIQGILKSEEIDILLFTAQWPETYSYTLSIALESTLPIIAPNVGAFPERLIKRENTLLYQYNESAQYILGEIMNFIDEASVDINRCEVAELEPIKNNYEYYYHDYLNSIKSKLGGRIEWDEFDNLLLTPVSASSGKASIHTFLWKLSYTKGFRWMRGDLLAGFRSLFKKYFYRKTNGSRLL